MGTRVPRSVAALAALAALLAVAGPARPVGVAFPGANGQIVFVRGGAILAVDTTGRGGPPLVTGDWNVTPAWSPDGKRIAFVRSPRGERTLIPDSPGSFEIYVARADGSGMTRLTENNAWDGNPAWSPDGSQIVFGSERSGRSGEIWTMDADGGDAKPTGERFGFDPAWSPNGKRIAFASSRKGIAQVFAMNADGSGVKQLTAETSGVTSPSWSPKSETIAFVRAGDIFLRTDSGVRRLTSTPDAEIEPVWSPDGTRIAFLSNRDASEADIGSGYELYVMGADGNGAKRLTSDPSDFGHAAWAPDGTAIAFTRLAGGDLRLFLIAPDGSNLRQVTASLPPNPSRLDWGRTAAEPAHADLAVFIAAPSNARVGKRVDFVVTVKNVSSRHSEPFGVRADIDDDRPGPKLGYVVGTLRESAEWPESTACGKAYTLCHAGLAPGKSAGFRLDATPKTKLSLIATATVRSFGLVDPVPANDSRRATVVVR